MFYCYELARVGLESATASAKLFDQKYAWR